MVAVVARPPFELAKKTFFTIKLLFYIFKLIEACDLGKFLYNIQQMKFFEEVTGRFVSTKLRLMGRKRDEV